MLSIGHDLEREKVAETETSGSLQPAEDLVGRCGEAQIDVPSGSGAVDAKLEDEPSLQRGRLAEGGDHPRQQAVEYEELAPTGEVRTLRRRTRNSWRFKSLLLMTSGDGPATST